MQPITQNTRTGTSFNTLPPTSRKREDQFSTLFWRVSTASNFKYFQETSAELWNIGANLYLVTCWSACTEHKSSFFSVYQNKGRGDRRGAPSPQIPSEVACWIWLERRGRHVHLENFILDPSVMLQINWWGEGVYRVLVGKPEGKRPRGRPRRRWVDNIKMDIQEVGCGYMDWIGLAQDRDR